MIEPLDPSAARALLITNQVDEADPIWGQSAYVYESAGRHFVLGDRCGTFVCSRSLRATLQNWSLIERAQLTTWIVDQNRMGDQFPMVTNDVLLRTMEQKPLRFSVKIDRFFLYLNDRGYRIGEAIFPGTGFASLESEEVKAAVCRWIEVLDDKELWGFMHAMEAAGYVSKAGPTWLPTAEGLLRIESLESQGAANDQAFVAMWFAPEMSEPYKKGIVPGLEDAGYRAFRIDQKEHSNKIDDEIIAEIRKSRFLVADFTSGTIIEKGVPTQIARGGVYYEAGFAQGLNMPVIWCVREDQIDLVHFDTRQFNHIVWKDADDLRVKLYRRVAAVLGHYRQS